MGVVKVAKTLRNNWKKSIFLCAAGGYGAKWYEKKLQDNEMMTNYCREALAFGSAPLPINDPGYHVTVILNPLAGGNKGKKNYEKYCAPLLNLAGLKVSVIKTTAANEAKSIMEVMSNTDAVLVAGGDGSFMETVTGLMRRPDALAMASAVPLGLLPLGTSNSLAKNIFPGANHDDVKLIAEATMAVVRQRFKNIDIIQVENRSEEFAGKKLYGVNRIEYGAWRDANNRTTKYWYWGGLKQRMTYVFGYLTAAKHLVWECGLDLKYTVAPPVQEISNVLSHAEEKPSMWSWLLGRKSVQATSQVAAPKTSSVLWEERNGFKGTQFMLEVAEGGMLEAKLFPENVGFFEFVKQGWSWVVNGNKNRMSSCVEGWEEGREVETIMSDTFYVDPKLPGGGEERNISLDGESIELSGPINVSLLRDQLKVFCNKEDAVAAVEREETKKQWWASGGSLVSGLVRGR